MASRSVRSIDVSNGTDAGSRTRNCSTISELLNVVPLSFRPTVGDILTKVYRVAGKLSSVGNTIAQYERHQNDGTVPPFIANTIKIPTVQFSNEYDGTPEGRVVKTEFEKIVKNARNSFLLDALKRKKEEQVHLVNLLKFDDDSWKAAVLETAERVAASLGSSISLDESGRWIWAGTSVPMEVKNEAAGLYLHGNTYHIRAIAIARSIADKALLQKVKSLTLKEKTSADAMDVDKKDKSVQELLDDALKKFEGKLVSGAITIKTKTTNPPKGGKGGGPRKGPQGGRNNGRINKSPPKKKQRSRQRN